MNLLGLVRYSYKLYRISDPPDSGKISGLMLPEEILYITFSLISIVLAQGAPSSLYEFHPVTALIHSLSMPSIICILSVIHLLFLMLVLLYLACYQTSPCFHQKVRGNTINISFLQGYRWGLHHVNHFK